MTISVTVVGDGLKRLNEAAKILGSPAKARRAYSMAVNDTGRKAATAAGRAIPGQTGLSATVGRKAVKKRTLANAGSLEFTVHGKGGDIALKYFKARETRKGASAAPWNARRIYPGAFMKAGWWPKRVVKPGWNGHVFQRVGASKFPIKVADSGLYLPKEMVQGEIASAWEKAAEGLQPRAEHIIRQMTKNVVS